MNYLLATDITVFDSGFSILNSHTYGQPLKLTNQPVIGSDWSKGPAGSNEVDFTGPNYYGMEYYRGLLAESWEMPELGTYVFHIRKGVHWALNPASEASRLVNGREVTGDDVYYNFQRYLTSPRTIIRTTNPALTAAASVAHPDKWTVTAKTPVDPGPGVVFFIQGNSFEIMPPEVIQKYGDMTDWRNSVGTGAFMLTDFVPGSAATLIRNPNYWDTDPVGPGKGNQLPYLDKVKFLIIPDVSTRMAAIRTAKVDWVSGVLLDDAGSLKKTTPDLKYKRTLPTTPIGIAMRTDKTELPFKDKRVRQALVMATDFNSIKNQLYGGDAEIMEWPGWPQAPELNMPPLDKLPANIQALYTYNPEQAKKLLAEAGYPNGFKTKILVQSIPTQVDLMSVVKAMWAKAGIDLELQPRESGVYTTVVAGRAYDEMLFMNNFQGAYIGNFGDLRLAQYRNASYINDPRVEEVFNEVQKYIIINQPKTNELLQGLYTYVLEQAWVITVPRPYQYTFWWPWIKNYHGELTVNPSDAKTSWILWVWIDQDLKEQMTGKR